MSFSHTILIISQGLSSSSPNLRFGANLKSKRQRPLSVMSVHSQCQPQCPGCLYLPARHTPSTHQRTVGRASLSPIHGVIYTLDPFIQPIRTVRGPLLCNRVFIKGMAPAERPRRPPVQHQLQLYMRHAAKAVFAFLSKIQLKI